jgi:hypothetical protein
VEPLTIGLSLTSGTAAFGIRKSVSTGVIYEDGRNDSNRKKDKVDEEFYYNILLDEGNKRDESILEKTKESIEKIAYTEKNTVINNATVVPKRGPRQP